MPLASAFSVGTGHADVAFTMKLCVQTDLGADREAATTFADPTLGGCSPQTT
jgi:hypothetical protein